MAYHIKNAEGGFFVTQRGQSTAVLSMSTIKKSYSAAMRNIHAQMHLHESGAPQRVVDHTRETEFTLKLLADGTFKTYRVKPFSKKKFK